MPALDLKGIEPMGVYLANDVGVLVGVVFGRGSGWVSGCMTPGVWVLVGYWHEAEYLARGRVLAVKRSQYFSRVFYDQLGSAF